MKKELLDGLISELDDYWMVLVAELKASLIKENRYASGNTAQSIGELNTKPIVVTAKGINAKPLHILR